MKVKWWHIAIALFVGMAIFGMILEATGLAPKQNAKPTGAMYMGGVVAIELANAGAVKPTAERLNAMARQAAAKNGTSDPEERSRFVRDFEFGFWQGWKTATK